MHELDDKSGCGCGCGHHNVAPLTAYDGPDWTKEPDDAVVCHCLGVTKGQVLEAIKMGAYTVPLLKIMTGTVNGNECKQKHPLGRSCEVDLEQLIRLYQDVPPPFESSGGCGC
jgi:NAD(P)H-nitrite reductase large subunit